MQHSQQQQQQQQPVVMRDVTMAAPQSSSSTQAVMSTDTGVKDSVSTTCSVSAMSISSVDVELDPDVRVICRDFIRGVCGRKRRCKFQHPDQSALDALVPCNPEKKYAFCHDYQNKTCERPSCKYIHCSSEEEQTYISKNLLSLKYKCQYELGIYNLQSTFKLPDSRKGSFSKFSPYTSENENDSKRHRSHGGSNSYSMPNCRSASEHEYPAMKPTQQQLLEELKKERNENEQLKERVAELQRRVADLSTMNEMLLEQNAQYRQNNRHNVQSQAQQAAHAAGHLAQAAAQVAQAQQVQASQIQPMHQPHLSQQVIHNIPNGHYQQSPVPQPPKYMVTPVSQQTAVITTVPQSAAPQTIMQPPVSTHATIGSLVQLPQMRPPPGIPHQAGIVQSDVSPNTRYNGNPNGMPVQIISNVPVASVQSLTVQPTPVQSTMPPPPQPQAELTQNQVTVAYQAAPPPPPRPGAPGVPNTPTGHLTGPGGININGYQDLQRISVHHQQHQ